MSRSALLQIPQNMQCRNNMQCRERQPGENMQQKESMGKTHCWELSRPAVVVIMEPTNTTAIFFIITILLMTIIIIIKSMVLAVWRCKLKWCSMLQSNWIHCIYKIKPALSISHPHHKSSLSNLHRRHHHQHYCHHHYCRPKPAYGQQRLQFRRLYFGLFSSRFAPPCRLPSPHRGPRMITEWPINLLTVGHED